MNKYRGIDTPGLLESIGENRQQIVSSLDVNRAGQTDDRFSS